MSAPGRPPITTPFWIGDTVYRVHGSRKPGLVLSIHLGGDPAYPSVLYKVSWPKDGVSDDHYGIELTKVRRAKEFNKT